MALALFEVPAVHPLALPVFATMTMQVVCLAIFLARMIHAATFYESTRKFWRDKKHVLITVTLALNILDMVIYGITMSLANNGVQWSRILRPMYLIAFNSPVRRGLRNIRRTLPDIINVMILMLLSVAIFALLMLELYREYNGFGFFKDYPESVWSIYVFVTSENNPNVALPPYKINRWSILMFIFFLVWAMYILMSIVLATVNNNHRKVRRRHRCRRFRCCAVAAAYAPRAAPAPPCST